MKADLKDNVVQAARHVVAAYPGVKQVKDPKRRRALMALRIALNAHLACDRKERTPCL